MPSCRTFSKLRWISSFLSTCFRGSPNVQWREVRDSAASEIAKKTASCFQQPKATTAYLMNWSCAVVFLQGTMPKTAFLPRPKYHPDHSCAVSKPPPKEILPRFAPGSPAHFFFGTIDSTTAHETKNYSSKKISEPKHHGDLIKMWRLSFACCDYMMGLQCHQRHNCWRFSIHRKPMTYIYIYIIWCEFINRQSSHMIINTLGEHAATERKELGWPNLWLCILEGRNQGLHAATRLGHPQKPLVDSAAASGIASTDFLLGKRSSGRSNIKLKTCRVKRGGTACGTACGRKIMFRNL